MTEWYRRRPPNNASLIVPRWQSNPLSSTTAKNRVKFYSNSRKRPSVSNSCVLKKNYILMQKCLTWFKMAPTPIRGAMRKYNFNSHTMLILGYFWSPIFCWMHSKTKIRFRIMFHAGERPSFSTLAPAALILVARWNPIILCARWEWSVKAHVEVYFLSIIPFILFF